MYLSGCLQPTVYGHISSCRPDVCWFVVLQACDGISTSRLCCKLLELHKNANQWSSVTDFAVALCKKRGQLKRVISDIVTLGISWLDGAPSREVKMKLIKTLASIAEGKVRDASNLCKLSIARFSNSICLCRSLLKSKKRV